MVRGVLAVSARQAFYYPEQQAFPDAKRRNFDAEAIFWAPGKESREGHLHLLTKHRSDTWTVLYRFEEFGREDAIPLKAVSRFDLGGGRRKAGLVTGAAFDRERGLLAVLTYYAVFIFRSTDDPSNYLESLVNRIALHTEQTRQVEAIAWYGDTLLVSNEEGDLFVINRPLSDRHLPRTDSGE